jgi:hypothetical protein
VFNEVAFFFTLKSKVEKEFRINMVVRELKLI